MKTTNLPWSWAAKRRGLLALAAGLASVGATGLVSGCAGELDKDPHEFTAAFADGARSGGASTGGSAGATGGAATGGTAGTQGGSAGGTGGATTPPGDDPCVTALFASKCNSCHGGDAAAGGHLKLDGTGVGARLASTTAKYETVADTSKCVPGALIIKAGDPNGGLLLKKVTGQMECGFSMPLGTTLMGADLTCIQTWLAKF